MAADVMRMDPTAIDADGETSGTETHFAGKRGSGSSETMSESVDVVSAKKNHHHRRKPSKKKRKWKPYSKMTWEEKREAEEREQLRADRIRCEMIKRGRPVAPYNTTQFIMAEHDTYEGDSLDQKDQGGSVFSTSGGHSVVNQTESPANTDDFLETDYTDSPHMAPEFISQDFSEAYERVQEESLSIMSRNDLVQEHISLERNLSYLQDRLAEEKSVTNSYSIKMQTVQEQLEELQTENNRLMQENYKLRFGKDAPSHTSDYEYEAPDQSDEESRLLTTGADELAQNGAMEYSVKEVVQSSVELMVVSSQSVQGICPEDYEADVASSEEPDKQEYRKKRRSNKGRLSVTRATLQNGTTSDDEDTNVPGNGPTTLDDFSKIRTKNGGTNITAEVKCEKHTNGNFAEPEPNKEFDGINMDGCSGGEKFPATASMESLTSSDC